ncbi:MAG: tetratricopeptide repeat protein [Gaiellales bacterium]|nr:MAG: tetratricopeptide repeat protein [Gaiellales bacterium]
MSDESAYGLYRRGEAFLRSRHPAQAAVVLRRAARQEPDKTSIREALGRAYFDSGDYERALAEFLLVVEACPTNSYAHYCLGRSAARLGREELSRRHLRLASAMGYEGG